MSSTQGLKEVSESEADKMEAGHDAASAEKTAETIASGGDRGQGQRAAQKSARSVNVAKRYGNAQSAISLKKGRIGSRYQARGGVAQSVSDAPGLEKVFIYTSPKPIETSTTFP